VEEREGAYLVGLLIGPVRSSSFLTITRAFFAGEREYFLTKVIHEKNKKTERQKMRVRLGRESDHTSKSISSSALEMSDRSKTRSSDPDPVRIVLGLFAAMILFLTITSTWVHIMESLDKCGELSCIKMDGKWMSKLEYQQQEALRRERYVLIYD